MKSGDVLFAGIVLALCLQGCGTQGTADQQAVARVEAESHGPTQGPVASAAAAEVPVAPGGTVSDPKSSELESVPPDVEVTQSDTLVTPGQSVEILVRATSDVTRIALSDGIHDAQPFVRDADTKYWRVTYRVPLRPRQERWGLSVTAKNEAGRWCRVWLFLHAPVEIPASGAPADSAAVPTH